MEAKGLAMTHSVAIVFACLLASSVCGGEQPLVVNVTGGAHNTPQCLEGLANCSTIGYALGAIAPRQPIIINVYYSHNFSNTSHLWHVHATQVSIVGYGNPIITCSKLGTGIAFNNSNNITIAGISWRGCSVLHPTSAFLVGAPYYQYHAFSALFFYECRTVTIRACHFSSSRGSGISMYNVRGHVLVEYSNFTDHNVSSVGECKNDSSMEHCSPQAIGMYVEFTFCSGFVQCNVTTANSTISGANYVISHCNFARNINPSAYGLHPLFKEPLDDKEFWPFGRGGGIAFMLRAFEVSDNVFSIHKCNFHDNHAKWAGGVYMRIYSYRPLNNTIFISYCNFINNHVTYSGGAMRLGMLIAYRMGENQTIPSNIESSNFFFSSVNFTGNIANWAGGLSIFNNPTNSSLGPLFKVILDFCVWEGNQAINSASAFGLTKWEEQTLTNAATVNPFLSYCSFINNKVQVPIQEESLLHGFGAVYTEGIPLEFYGNTTFTLNDGSALYISSTGVTFKGNVNFTRNIGVLGGGIHMTGTSWIALKKGVHILFERNNAFQYGAGIYYTFPPSLALPDSKGCFIRYIDPLKDHVPLREWEINVTFVDNVATQAGDAIYVTSTTECDSEDDGNIFDTKFHYLPNRSKPWIATPPQKVEFVSQRHDITVDDEGWSTYSVMPGEAFDLELVVLDGYNSTSSTSVLSVRCQHITQYVTYDFYNDLCDESKIYSLEGARVFTSNKTLSSLRLSGPRSTEKGDNNSDLILIFKTDEATPVIAPLRINFLPCRLGMDYDDEQHKCVCIQGDSKEDYIRCYSNDGETIPCIELGSWFGIAANMDGQTVYGYSMCPFGHCKQGCAMPCNNIPNWCAVPEDPTTEDVLCEPDFTGPLCSLCKDSLSLTFDSYSCSKCGAGEIIGLTLLIVVYWIAVVVEIVVFVRLNIRVDSGGLYGFLFFYSVLKYIYIGDFPFRLDGAISFLVGFTTLDPEFLAYTKFCLFPGVTSLFYQVLHYVHPIAITILLYALISIDRRFGMSLFTGDATTNAFCILLLISYTSLADTSLNILQPLTYTKTFPSHDLTVVRIQPHTSYMDLKHHLPFALIAIAVELLIVMPVTVLMFIAPWLMKRVNLTRIKPLLDQYQGCYKDQYRWFAGVYLLGRHLFLITVLWVFDFDMGTYLQQILCLGLLLLHIMFQPYRKQWLNNVDTLLLVTLTLLALLTGHTALFAFDGPWLHTFRGVLICFFALLPILYPLTALVLYTWRIAKPYCKARGIWTAIPSDSGSLNADSYSSIAEEDLPALREESVQWGSFHHAETSPLIRRDARAAGASQQAGRKSNTMEPFAKPRSLNVTY